MKKQKIQKAVARVVLDDTHRYGEAGRKDIAKWLRMVACELVAEGRDYSNRFTSKYFVTEYKP